MARIQQLSLRWNNYLRHVTSVFNDLRTNEDLVDVTLCCEGKKIRAHKMLLSACSPYFREIFKENPCQHPVIIFRNVRFEDLLGIIHFMYHGEVSVIQEHLASFLTTAELLEVQGLTDHTDEKNHDIANLNNVDSHETFHNTDITDSDIAKYDKEELLSVIPNTRKRKADFEENNEIWENENVDNFIDSKQGDAIPNPNTETENVTADQIEIEAMVINNPPMESIVLSVNEDNLQHGQSSSKDASGFKLANISSATSEDTLQNTSSNDCTLKDSSQGTINWTFKIPLGDTDALQDNTSANKALFKAKKLTFERKLDLVDMNQVQMGSLICEVCDMSFKHPSSLSHHKKTHKQEITCKVCSKTFSRSYNLIRHIKTSHAKYEPIIL